jgi:DNA-directed RNA polymerase beta subunit
MAPIDDLNALVQPPTPSLRDFSDYNATRKNIFDGVYKSVASKFPLQNARYTVELKDLKYGKNQDYTLKEQQEALMQNQSLFFPLRGKLILRDNATGAVIDKTDKSITLARVPYLTNRGTFINAGSEYTVANQSRLLPGTYVRKRKSGEYEAHFNTLPGKGRGFRVAFMPDTGKFVTEIGQSIAPLYPMLKAYGVEDTALEKYWGKEIFAVNKAASQYDAARIFERLTNKPSKGMDEASIYQGIQEALYKTELDPEVTKRTLGRFSKAASVPLRGTLKIDDEGYITVPAGLIDGVYYALRDSDEARGIAPANDKARLVAITADEIKKLKKLFKSKFQATCGSGRRFTYTLQRVLPPNNGEYFVDIDCPELEQLRKSLLLDSKPAGGFRIVIGVKVAEDINSLLNKSAAPAFEIMDADFVNLNDEDFSRVTGNTLLRASQKVLNAQKGVEDVDDRDALTFQRFYGPEDFFSERIEKDAGGALRTALFKATNKGNLQAFRNSVLTPVLNGVLMGSGLGAPIEEVNPMEILDQNLRVIRTGEGGIGSSSHGVPLDTRSVQPSHLGFLDPVRTPESDKVGIDLRLTIGARKGSDGQIYSRMRNMATGQMEDIPARLVTDSVVAFPGELAKSMQTGDPVRAMVRGQISYVNPEEVQYEVPSYASMFNVNSNLVPGVSGLKGGRLLMGSKYFTQALPVQEAEAPLVQSLNPENPNGQSFEESVTSFLGAVRADSELGSGLVTAVTPDYIEVKYGNEKKRYELYNNFPFNRKTYIHNTPNVVIGDKVKPGQLLAKSNYTDNEGRLAMGKNLKVAYTVWGDEDLGGSNFEDGVVISETAAKKMSSEHMYTVGYDSKDDYVSDYSKFISLFPGQYSKDQLKTMDASGVVKPGTILKPGDPIILGVGERKSDTFGLVKKSRPTFTNRAQTWDHSEPGLVTNVTKTKSGHQVAIKSYKTMAAGDKLVGRYGDKGVISVVVPDADMPQDKDGNPYEVIYNPLALVTRVNPVQAVEAALGKLAARTGQPVKMPAFMDESLVDYAQRALKQAGISDTESIFDPRLNRKVDNVFTGNRYFMNLHHQAEKKLSGRDIGGYSTEEAPVKGGAEGAKRIGIADINALLAHGAIEVIKDARLIRGQKNDEYWRAVKAGTPVPKTAVPFVWDKFVAQLKAAGVNVTRQGGTVNIYGMTGADVKALSGGEVKEARDIDFRTGKSHPGGFFDERIFGVNQSSFGHFPLAAKIVNPVMEDVVRSLAGITQKDFEAVMMDENVKGIRGSKGLQAFLSNYDVKSEIEKTRQELQSAKGQKRSNAISKLAYLETMDKRKIKPSDFMWDSMPVLPPRFRPITDTGSMQMVADMNYLYKELFSMNKNLKELQEEIGAESTGKEKLALYKMVKATVGLADPASAKLKQKNVNGLIRHILGSNPKFSMFQRKVLSSTVEGVGNAVIAPDPSMDMDHVGIPEDMAYTVFRPYIIRALTASGANPIEALKQVENRTESAKRALLSEMEKRPVLITRAPVLHKYNFLAAKPVLTAGSTMRMSPSVVVGFNADFDGDQMRLHVPSSAGAVREAYERMLPSRNLLSAATFQAHPFIKNEFLYGLFLASKDRADKKNIKTFRTKDDVIRAFNRGELNANDTVKIVGGA